ncbi:hypothetical protein HYO65_gp207 [Tenacibaculum phage PTm1]|uniref:Uncharacterized protein n=2 Tax=Shirahamavirus PTm1 TaxID=2846435 RepID=A0A5S9HXL9_9CAUD|nr:hypothetical protein HYO65_gp207 [Tenacibaculum phage PTm1]BBI90599.1 hypothetical protein [Tenacibaculum phage PTm1]BBI90906.1 hypothetical protein [Tenacibaculum phage PTm5]
MKNTFTLILVKDSFGNTAYNTVEDTSDTIMLSDLRDKDNQPIYFESEAYHACSLEQDGCENDLKVIRF